MTSMQAFRSGAARRCVAARAQQDRSQVTLQQRGAALALAGVLSTAGVANVAQANEFDLLSEPTPTNNYLIDDAKAINKTTKKEVNDRLKRLEFETGYRVEAVTVRKLEVEADAFAFNDRLLDQWFDKDNQAKKGIFLIVTSGKDGALSGGKEFVAALGDDFIDSVVGENVVTFTQEEKYNECLNSSTKRIEAILTGKNDPGPPIRKEVKRERTYKTKAESDEKKTVSVTVVGTLLVISVVVPMLQYYGYTSKD